MDDTSISPRPNYRGPVKLSSYEVKWRDSWSPRVTCYVHGFDQDGLHLGYQQDKITSLVKTLRVFR